MKAKKYEEILEVSNYIAVKIFDDLRLPEIFRDTFCEKYTGFIYSQIKELMKDEG